MLKSACVLLLSLITTALAKMEGHIVGGSYAKIHNHAHSAFLSEHHCVEYKSEKVYVLSDKRWICGASIVTQNILLTAAHCLYGCTFESHIVINVGNENRQIGENHLIQSFMINEDYDPRTNQNDICLLKSLRPILLNKNACRVALLENPPLSEKAVVAGWGIIGEIHNKNNSTAILSNLLKFVPQTVLSRNKCLEVSIRKIIPKGTFCAAHPIPGNSPEKGDSGSALVVRGYIQIGIVSYKKPTIDGGYVVVYTNVGYFFKWIQYYSRLLACAK